MGDPLIDALKAIKPKCEWDDEYPLLPSIDVPEHEAVDTGLIDERGDCIFRAPRPIGFGRDAEQ